MPLIFLNCFSCKLERIPPTHPPAPKKKKKGKKILLNTNTLYVLFMNVIWFTCSHALIYFYCFITKYYLLLMQITFSLLFSLVIAFVSDALSAAPDKTSVLSRDASFRHEFHEIVRWEILVVCFLLNLYNVFAMIQKLLMMMHGLGDGCWKWFKCWGLCWRCKACLGRTLDVNLRRDCCKGVCFKCFIKWFRLPTFMLGSSFLKQCLPVIIGKSSSNCGLPGLFVMSLFSLLNFYKFDIFLSVVLVILRLYVSELVVFSEWKHFQGKLLVFWCLIVFLKML